MYLIAEMLPVEAPPAPAPSTMDRYNAKIEALDAKIAHESARVQGLGSELRFGPQTMKAWRRLAGH